MHLLPDVVLRLSDAPLDLVVQILELAQDYLEVLLGPIADSSLKGGDGVFYVDLQPRFHVSEAGEEVVLDAVELARDLSSERFFQLARSLLKVGVPLDELVLRLSHFGKPLRDCGELR
uniref:Uncharacterized protein n=1 Tax=Strombidium inclinatum TaxID=197538 RepID=A0A7S3IH29_9SPIT